MKKWFEDYSCGCVSDEVRFKKDLTGYCGRHGNSRRQVWPGSEHPFTKEMQRRAPTKAGAESSKRQGVE